MAQWLGVCGLCLVPLGEALKDFILGHEVIHVDLAMLQPLVIDAYFVTDGAQRWSRISAGLTAKMLRMFLSISALGDAALSQEPITRCCRRVIDLVHPRTVARLGLQLERGVEEVDVQGDDAFSLARAFGAAAPLGRP